jgi:hypothetical protein
MSWHLEEDTVRRYQAGVVGVAAAASVEAHLTSCPHCRQLLDTDEEWLESSWEAVTRSVDNPRPYLVERVLRLAGLPTYLARLLAVTPSLRVSWLLAVSVALGFSAVASTVSSGSGKIDLFLAVAPLVPVAGVAVAYGRLGDPAHEITVATPIDSVRLLLLRTAVVTASAVLLSFLMDVLLRSSATTGAWLLPALALTTVTLALGTRLTMWLAASVTAGGWVTLLTVTAARSQGTTAHVFTLEAQFGFLVALVGAGLILAMRRDLYRRGRMT